MIQFNIRKRTLAIFIILVLVIGSLGGIYLRARYNEYRNVSCIACHRMTQYLINTEQPLWSDEVACPYDKTVDELAYQFRNEMLWLCEPCSYAQAESVYRRINEFPLNTDW